MQARQAAIDRAGDTVTSGQFQARLAELIALPTVSQAPQCGQVMRQYLEELLAPDLRGLGFACTVLNNPVAPELPFLLAERTESAAFDTVLVYGHGDVVAAGDGWTQALDPFQLVQREGRLYGRGTADNKGQHALNIEALRAVIATRGFLGFNCRLLIEMGEERGSPGLADLLRTQPNRFKADVLIASDGPRLDLGRPTLFLGARGSLRFTLAAAPRDRPQHSGHWGGLLTDPAIRMAHALASLTDARGALRVPEWRPGSLTDDIRRAIADCGLGDVAGRIDPDWGEPGLTPAERVFGWNSLSVLALAAGNDAAPVAAIAASARAVCQLRFVVGTDAHDIVPALRRYLDAAGFSDVTVAEVPGSLSPATRTDLRSPWVDRLAGSITRTLGNAPAILPNIGGSVPNHVFADIAGMPTVWIPHSHRACGQHSGDEHMDLAMAEQALRLMAGIVWDCGLTN
ncbi:M20/M25/M40 family metallo-hydrolase [Fertoebacter nigrum]|uniref:M20/M25/M40 family metallo-hydrolase n=1 Tax=Fertoeibacter niger TaxID=2656921 RepID=A0A8X8GWL8_9RHOB|nr:M20/M25/M40 family metallo-hydrolase [Fertoeibacter niger]